MKKLLWATLWLWCGGMLFPSLLLAQPAFQASSVRCADGSYPLTVAVSEVFAGAANGEVLPLLTGARIRIFGWSLQSTVDTTMRITFGTGTDCATGTTNVTGNTSPFSTVSRPFSHPTLPSPLIVPTISQALCLNAGAACTISGWMSVCQEP